MITKMIIKTKIKIIVMSLRNQQFTAVTFHGTLATLDLDQEVS